MMVIFQDAAVANTTMMGSLMERVQWITELRTPVVGLVRKTTTYLWSLYTAFPTARHLRLCNVKTL